MAGEASETTRGDVEVAITGVGSDRYTITVTASFESPPDDVAAPLWNWEHLVQVGLPGITSDFVWLTGGPDEVPSTFKFEIGDATLREEIYERTE